MAKKQKEKDLIVLDDLETSIVAKFTITEVKMKNDWRWKIKMLVHSVIKDAHHDYSIRLEFDDRPFLRSIDQYEKEAKEISDNPSMFKDVDKKNIKAIDDKIANVKKEMNKLRVECTDIEFIAQTEEIKYGSDTLLLFKVLDTVVQQLNEKKYRLGDYRAVLQKITE